MWMLYVIDTDFPQKCHVREMHAILQNPSDFPMLNDYDHRRLYAKIIFSNVVCYLIDLIGIQ